MIDITSIIAAISAICLGLLFIDLVPLQEINVCKGDYKNSSSCPDVFFAQSYFAARMKFINAATSAKAVVESHVIYEEAGVNYTMETAFLRGNDSKRLLVHLSGTHGVEGYTGSAIQVKLLSEWNTSRENGPSVLFVHAVNPYGMAHFRRVNEKNVDLNRNYLSADEWEASLKRDSNIANYDDIRALLMPDRAPRFIDRYLFIVHLAKALVLFGYNSLKRGLVTGQYHDPEGLFFGGKEEQTSIAYLRKILNNYSAASVEKSILIDVHTGLGPHGVDTMMVDTEEEESVAKKIFASAVQNTKSTTSGVSAGYDLMKGSIRPTDILGKDALFFLEEFGTVNSVFTARDLFLENAANNYARGSYVHEIMRTWLRDSFYPQHIAYKNSVLKRGTEAFNNAWAYLAAR